jgi:hypothetical protein
VDAKSADSYDPASEIVTVGSHIPDFEESIIVISFVTFKRNKHDAPQVLLPA